MRFVNGHVVAKYFSNWKYFDVLYYEFVSINFANSQSISKFLCNFYIFLSFVKANIWAVQYWRKYNNRTVGFLKCQISRIKRIKFFYRHNEKVLRKLSSNICTENKAYIKRLKNINRRRIKEKHEIRVQNSLSFSNLLGLIYNQEGRSPKENLLTAVHLR